MKKRYWRGSIGKAAAVFIGCLFATVTAHAADGDYVWAKQMGGSSSEAGQSVAVDADGNVYTTGEFSGTADFDPGAGTANLTAAGLTDIFVSKLNSSGALVWAKQMGGLEYDYGYSVVVDADGNVYIAGNFRGTADFDPGAGTANLTAAGSADIFVSKLNSSGNYVWAKQMGGSSGDFARSVVVDSSGNVYTTGYFVGTADFDPGAGTANLTAGSIGIFVSKLNSSGAFVWAKQLGASGSGYGWSVAVDSSGNVYTTGRFAGTADFDPGAGTANLTAVGSYDIFVSKLDSSGAYVWAKRMGGGAFDYGNSVAVDASGNVYTTGFFEGMADFDPGAGTANLTSAGNADIFVSKLDSSGAFVWAKQMGGGGFNGDYGRSVAVDADGNVYTTGFFSDTADFDPGAGTANLTSAGSTDIFVSKLNSSGAFVWAKQMGGGAFDYGYSVAVDASGNVYTTGDFAGTVDFDPGAGTANLTSVGSYDIFVSKLSGRPPAVSAVTRLDANPTNASSVDYSVVFDQSVTGVDASDFVLTATGTVTGPLVTGVSGSGAAYTVTVGAGTGDGTLRLDVADDDTIINGAAQPLGGPGAGNGAYTSGEAYTIDKTAPTVGIGAPSASITAGGPVTYTVTYTGADAVTLANGDVTLNTTGDATGTVAVSGSGTSSRTVTISGITGNGTLGISIAANTASDTAGNQAAAEGPSSTFNVDNTAIAVNIGAASASSTSAGPVSYVVTYDNVTSVSLSAGDITLNSTGTANASVAVGPVVKSEQTLQRQVTLSSITGTGTLGISIASGTATDDLSNSAPAAGPSATFDVDNTAPGVQSVVLSSKKGLMVDYIVTFTEAVTGVDVTDFALTTTGAVTGAFVSAVSGSGAVYTVTIDTGTGNGTIRLDVIDDDTILDGVGNPLGGAGVGNGGFTAGEVYNATTGTGMPLDWRWSFAAMVIASGLVLARRRLRPRLN